jgi:acetate kinase
MNALALNAGSSSLKAALYALDAGAALAAPAEAVWQDQVEWDSGIGHVAAREMLRTLPLDSPSEVAVVGHRIVHGGERFREPAALTDEVKVAVRSMAASAPLHHTGGLAGVAVAEELFGDAVPQVAVFDTAFHSGLPPAAYAYAGPHEWLARGLRRYGFHGISHEYAAQRAARLLDRPLDELRLITCHLGSGCSLAAIRDGRSVDTTMGFTPLEGVAMGTRSGSLDPGLILHLLREEGASLDGLDTTLHHGSGLRGLSGRSGDLREVLAARDAGDDRARLAVDVYVHRLRFHIGALLGALGGLDAVVFTGGVGEHAAEIRDAALRPFAFLGLQLDDERNAGAHTDCDVAADGSPTRVLVIRAREEWAIALAAHQTVAGRAEARGELERNAGTQFCPTVAEAALDALGGLRSGTRG